MTDLVTLYRVEVRDTDTGEWHGPYRDFDDEKRDVYTRMSWAHSEPKHPVPKVFGSLFKNGTASDTDLCACPSMRLLFAWFGGWLPLMLRKGARIRKIVVPACAISFDDGRQVVYDSTREVTV